jgi:prevent-host-death family protein
MSNTTHLRRAHYPLREAKNRLSELVKRAANGEQITITLHGVPRARLSPVTEWTQPFQVDRDWLRDMKVSSSQTPADALIRSERDGRD